MDFLPRGQSRVVLFVEPVLRTGVVMSLQLARGPRAVFDFATRMSEGTRMLLIPGTGNGERGTGNGEPGTGHRSLGTNVHLRIQNGGQNRKARRETIWVKVSFHRLCPHMASMLL